VDAPFVLSTILFLLAKGSERKRWNKRLLRNERIFGIVRKEPSEGIIQRCLT
jgi:hypothetical protein